MLEEKTGLEGGTGIQDPLPVTENDPANKPSLEEIMAGLVEEYGEDAVSSAPVVQQVADRRVSQAMTKAERKMREAEAAATKKALRTAKETKLLEDKQYEELLALKEKEASEATAELEKYKRDENVTKLLKKRGIVDPDLDAIFHSIQTEDLTELDTLLDSFLEGRDRMVQEGIEKRLTTKQPPKSPKDKKPEADSDDLFAQIAKAESEMDYPLSIQLKAQLKTKSSEHGTVYTVAEPAG